MASTSTSPVVELQNVGKHFGGVKALQEVSLQLWAGQVHCLAGENGSGKSTLIKVLAGVYRPNEGTIAIAGHPFRHLTPIESVRQGIQVIYQDFSLFPNLTVRENLTLNRQLEQRARFISYRRMRQSAQQALDRLGVTIPLDATVDQLPVAQKQLVAIARALAQDVRLMILDEPTTALTHIEVDRLFEIVRNLKQQDVAILFVSHKLREMQIISDHFTVLRNGRVAAEGSASEFDPRRITESMTGRTISTERHPRSQCLDDRVLLEVSHLSSPTLHDVSLQLAAGEIVGLTGLLGSGQTELALSLFGLRRCHRGQILVADHRRPIRSVRDAIAAGIAYVPEDRLTEGLFLAQSIESNVVAAYMDPIQSKLGMISPRRSGQHAEHWLSELGVRAADRSAAIRTLSGGNQQRVVLAKWLSRHPKILILNGPTAGVDVGSKAMLHEKLRQLADTGVGVLMISDDLPELAQHCDRVLVMHRGRIVDELRGDRLAEETISDCLSHLE